MLSRFSERPGGPETEALRSMGYEMSVHVLTGFGQ